MYKPKSPIRVYYFSTQPFYRQTDQLILVLSEEEKEKSGRFRFEKDRLNYIGCHGLLRHILSKEINMPPAKIEFLSEKNGKPFLRNNTVRFNLSHTKWLCAIAVSDTDMVGIDTEKIREHNGYLDIAEKYFTAEELSVLELSKEPLTVFFRFWTRKEACVKATGRGLNSPLAKINTAVSDSSPVLIPGKKNKEDWFYLYTSVVNDHIISIASVDKIKPVFQEIKQICF